MSAPKKPKRKPDELKALPPDMQQTVYAYYGKSLCDAVREADDTIARDVTFKVYGWDGCIWRWYDVTVRPRR